jgi:hypothetical protein
MNQALYAHMNKKKNKLQKKNHMIKMCASENTFNKPAPAHGENPQKTKIRHTLPPLDKEHLQKQQQTSYLMVKP